MNFRLLISGRGHKYLQPAWLGAYCTQDCTVMSCWLPVFETQYYIQCAAESGQPRAQTRAQWYLLVPDGSESKFEQICFFEIMLGSDFGFCQLSVKI